MASVDEIKSKVCESVMEAAKVPFPEDEVIPVSGLCGVYANRLHSTMADERARTFAARELSMWPQLNLPCGQGEDVMTSLQRLSSDLLAKHLEEASGIHILEQR